MSMKTETKPRPESGFIMVDVGRKRVTRRRAVATGSITVGAEALRRIRENTLPKGDVLLLAEIAGIAGAKRTADLLPMCHNLPLDQVTVQCLLREPDAVEVYCQAAAQAKTGVEMEAVMGVQAALACIWDLVKPVNPALEIGEVRLLVKQGGKSGLWVNPGGIPDWLAVEFPQEAGLEGVTASVLVMSDRAARGDYEDKSGKLLQTLLREAGADVTDYRLIADEAGAIAASLEEICRTGAPDVLLATGGTGPGPRDVTPEVVEDLCDRMLDGMGELLRRESAAFTDTAWLSRMTAGMRGRTLIIALPGSPKAVAECWEIFAPFLRHALRMIAGQGHEKRKERA